MNEFDGLDAVQAWRSSNQFKQARKVGDKYAFRAFLSGPVEGSAR
jgi:hypothetical protein